MADGSGYSDEFLGKLRNYDVPLDDLRDCIIGQDIRDVNADIANMWAEMVEGWCRGGLRDHDVVNLFFHVACSQLASVECDNLMGEIEKYLDGGGSGE